jgi:hypothetical protein
LRKSAPRSTCATAPPLSYFLQVDARGGEDYFGAGGKTGVRVTW